MELLGNNKEEGGCMNDEMTLKVFINRVLAGTATGILIGLIPNAVLAAILKLFGNNTVALTFTQIGLIFQLATPLIIGTLIASHFQLEPLKMLVVGGAAFVGSGVIKYDTQAAALVGAGTGDIINTMLTASLAILVITLIGDTFGSVSIVLTPIVAGVGVGAVGYFLYPYVAAVTAAVGNGINAFTTLQPVLMSVLISCSFAFLILSPISTVAIGVAIQLNGLAAGAAAMGVAATTIVLIVNSWKINKSGVTMAIALGAMKMMMPNLFRKPVILVSCFFTASLAALSVAFFSISGTPASAGFGLVGLVGPLAALEQGLNPGIMLFSWFLVPLAGAFFSQFVCEKVLKLYNRREVFEFLGE